MAAGVIERDIFARNMVHTFNGGTQETEAGSFLSLKLALSVE